MLLCRSAESESLRLRSRTGSETTASPSKACSSFADSRWKPPDRQTLLPPCSCRYTLIGRGSGANGSSLSSILVPQHHDGRRNSKAGVRTYHNSYHHSKRERSKNFPTHQEQNQNG